MSNVVRLDRLHLINVFAAVVDVNSFAGAARKLGISAPAVTRAIAELEKHLGVRLLMRTTRVVRVTEAGARYAEDCKRILSALADADGSVAGLHGSPRGDLTVTAPSLFGAKFVMPIVTEYLLRYPEVSAACWLLDRVVNMLDEGIDIAVCIGEPRDSSMRAIRVGQVRRVICAAPSYLAAHSLPLVPADLARHRIVWAGAVTTTPEWHLDDSGQPVTVRLQPRLITTTNDSAIVAAVEGFGLTRLLSYQVAAQLRAGQLKIVLSEFDPVHCPFNWCTARVGTPPRRRGHSLIWPSSGSGPIPP